MQNKSLSGLAALITSIVVAGGLIWSIVQYSIDSGRQERLQGASYAELKKQLEAFSTDVASDIKEMRGQIQDLKVEVAVLKALRARPVSLESKAEPEPPAPPRAKTLEFKDFSQLKEESLEAK